jgi:hypothetical protein
MRTLTALLDAAVKEMDFDEITGGDDDVITGGDDDVRPKASTSMIQFASRRATMMTTTTMYSGAEDCEDFEGAVALELCPACNALNHPMGCLGALLVIRCVDCGYTWQQPAPAAL